MATETQLVSLTAKLAKSHERLDVHYTVHNGDKTPLLLLNGLWKGSSSPEADTQKVYRFVASDTLRLLLGPAPLPRTSVTYKNVPEATRLEPYSTFEADLSTALPATEYNVYFSQAPAEERVEARVQKIELFVSYVDATGVETTPSRIHANTLQVVSPLRNVRTLGSGPLELTLDALRQTGEFSRFGPR